jgi:hypothetical protein
VLLAGDGWTTCRSPPDVCAMYREALPRVAEGERVISTDEMTSSRPWSERHQDCRCVQAKSSLASSSTSGAGLHRVLQSHHGQAVQVDLPREAAPCLIASPASFTPACTSQTPANSAEFDQLAGSLSLWSGQHIYVYTWPSQCESDPRVWATRSGAIHICGKNSSGELWVLAIRKTTDAALSEPAPTILWV